MSEPPSLGVEINVQHLPRRTRRGFGTAGGNTEGMANLFSQSIHRKELLMFALGEGEYHVEGPSETDRTGTGHGVAGSWNQSIMDLYDDDKNTCADGVRSMFTALAGNSPAATATRVWPLIDHLDQYWTQRHAGWVEFDLGKVAQPIAAAVTAERERCQRGESDVSSATIETAIAKIQRNGGLTELR